MATPTASPSLRHVAAPIITAAQLGRVLRIHRWHASEQPIVGMAATPDGKGYWLVASDGGIFNFGDAGFYGSTGSIDLNAPIVGMASTPDGHGYWLVAKRWRHLQLRRRRLLWLHRGFAFAHTHRGHGSHTGRPWVLAGGQRWWHLQLRGRRLLSARPGRMHLNKPIVGMAATPDGRGYWLVASDGGIFNFGDAGFYGSTGAHASQQADRRHGAHARRQGVLVAASDGGIFNFGDAPFHGSVGARTSMTRSSAWPAHRLGYWLVALTEAFSACPRLRTARMRHCSPSCPGPP